MNKTEAMIEISGDMGDFVAPAHSPHDVDPSNRNGQFITDTEVVSAIGLRYRSRGHLLTSLTSQNKGDEWKVDYHVVGMCLEAIQCLEQRPHPATEVARGRRDAREVQ